MPAIQGQPNLPVQPQVSAPKQTHLDKIVDTVHENTKEGTFIGDNMALVGAGTLVGGAATISGAVKLADKFPAVEKALEFTFVKNGLLVGGAASLGTAALLGEDAVASFQEGSHGKAAAEAAGALVTGLGGAELVGRQYNIPVMKQALSTPLEKAYAHKEAIAGAAIATGGALLLKDGVENLKDGNSVMGGIELTGGSLAVLGSAELVGRRYNIPVMKEALSTPAEWVGKNVKAVTGAAAVTGGAAALVKGAKDLSEGKKLQGGAEIAGGVVGTLGGAELIGRQYNIPVMKEALTGTAKALFTSKGGIIVSGGAVAASGLAAGADGVRRLTTQKGIINDAVGVAEVTAGVAGATGGASLIGLATQNEKLIKAFPENLPILGGTALIATSAALGKYTAEDIKANGFEITHVATGTAAALTAMGGTQLIADKLGVPMLDKAFDKGWKPVAAVGLGATAYKLGELTLEQADQMLEKPGLGRGLITAGAATATVLTGAGAVAVTGNVLGIPVLENAGMKVLNGTKTGVVKTAEFVSDKAIKPVFEFAVKHPGVTLGALAVAGGVGYYAYNKNKGE
ncbi:hypothetical protein COW36_17990 [bacterium (Candidatus Blackallbacteria) CG17_big_fil_post_rev_8_21_14_2_50_48_46]|uniref:Uncharacterized protein n=1 Tax=bacterium (Candidatus Blackallbacteria) CG17_big_fil_post_rev_8_21_14_2_50_48_46 TaxID=2014261 RepID=A0A2M7G197_9BACT|nr:MAG: hypothetical protein COW64_00735 [bacterium (Candidatus Blackallbacteria) CG18_big_fil_WC_8_21_14_2_50_49_26]PIW15307.1 MAG: hypothetical protein COW36_17990 [bacterium (Candidatus Blackallbacteria) CG17_big_fil_post_rev_8_21_14_2_50_48_46]PIW45183.1 MAG: hypothetical protein COW20_21025 [bacterium (Candidatus Blackallbacteria) CG13_big_fil_rev_8_21_14_2_50_49_14]